MTPQEIFNKIVPALLAQNAKAMDHGCCVLIAEDGKRCAYGMLLPAHLTVGDMYSESFSVEKYFEKIGVDWTINANTIQGRLFVIHNYREPAEWPTLFRQAAKDFGLVFPT